VTAFDVVARVCLQRLAPVAVACCVGGDCLADPARAVVPVPYMLACGATEHLEAALTANGEAVVAQGKATDGPVTQLWLNPSNREWSVVFVDPASGRSCLVAAGADFVAERLAPRRPGASRDKGA
jgi:hypothetical protein